MTIIFFVLLIHLGILFLGTDWHISTPSSKVRPMVRVQTIKLSASETISDQPKSSPIKEDKIALVKPVEQKKEMPTQQQGVNKPVEKEWKGNQPQAKEQKKPQEVKKNSTEKKQIEVPKTSPSHSNKANEGKKNQLELKKAEADKKKNEAEKKKQEEAKVKAEAKKRQDDLELKRRQEEAKVEEAKIKEKEKEVQNKLASLKEFKNHPAATTVKSSLPIPKEVENLHIDSLPSIEFGSANLGGTEEISYREKIHHFLRQALILPDYGAVEVKLTLNKSGKVIKLETIRSKNQRNLTYIENTLPTLTFPSLDKFYKEASQYTFIITLDNGS